MLCYTLESILSYCRCFIVAVTRRLGICSGKYLPLWQAANDQEVSCTPVHSAISYLYLQIAKSMLSDRAKGRHKSRNKAFQCLQKLTPEEEQALIDWCEQKASEATPWTPPPKELRAHAELISGKTVGKKWHQKFHARHPELRATRPTKQDLSTPSRCRGRPLL